MKKTVLLLETIADEAMALLMDRTNVVIGYDQRRLQDTAAYEHVHAIITRGKGLVDQTLIRACPNLEVIARCGVGLDNVDVAAATARGIKVVNTPGANAGTVAEHTLSLMLMSIRDLYRTIEQVKQGNWAWRNVYNGDELMGKTLGILGMGNIGKRVARLAEAFEMRVIYWNRSKQDVSYPYLPLEEVLSQADIVSLHLPYTPGDAPLIGVDELTLMKPAARLINTARGALIDHEALLNALHTEQLSGFAADVLPDLTPAISKALVSNPQVLVTPHASSLTATTYRQMCLLAVGNVLEILLEGKPDIRSIFNYEKLSSSP